MEQAFLRSMLYKNEPILTLQKYKKAISQLFLLFLTPICCTSYILHVPNVPHVPKENRK